MMASRVRRFTVIQRSNIDELEATDGLRVAFAGIDATGNPVVEVRGAHGVKYIAWRPEGVGRPPTPPVRDYTEEELELVHQEDADLLYGLPYAVGSDNPQDQTKEQMQHGIEDPQ